MTVVKLHLRQGGQADDVDLDTLTPKARALAEAIHMSVGHQPIGVLHATGRVKGDVPNFRYRHGNGPEADALAEQPDHRFVTNYALIGRDSAVTAERWLEEQARSVPYDAWPIAGARSRMEPLEERVPSAEAARVDRCLTRDQALHYLAEQSDRTIILSNDAWIMLQKAGNAPAPRHHALGGQMPLWAVEDLDAYVGRQFERWTVTRVAEELGYSGPSATGTARKQLSRWGLSAVGRAPGRGGESLFAADQVRAAQAVRPGRGRHGATRQAGRFT
ncbi:hypothetical protein ACIHJG_37270 [Streptomyces sp. NPDC052415]|uniref:hypothetical protein n=1 Tax=Streptomyces sp. NPDC052415 TaxID=3365690 RepID=UPI0037D92B3A